MAGELITKVVDYIRQNHEDVRSYIPDDIQFTVTGSGRERIGYSRVIHTGSGWTITIGHTLVPGAPCEIHAVYGDDYIVWTGTSDGTAITEESYRKLES